jgi:tRNA(Ile)-lysidine synthase
MNEKETIEDAVFRALEKREKREKTGKKDALFLAAVSGGADSTALLAALCAVKNGFGARCLHVDHGIRPQAETRADAEFVRDLCGRFGVACTVVSIPPGKIERVAKKRGIGVEAAARFFRQRAWLREMERVNAERVLVAHTQDDLLETILMRLLKGSGSAGLAGIKEENYPVLRPFLSVSRAGILAYLEKRGIPFRTDSTNADVRFFRNRVRLKLIPVLDAFFPDWRKNLLSMADIQRETADFLKNEAESRVKWEKGGKGGLYTGENFFNNAEIIREEALFQAIDRLVSFEKFEKKGKKPRRAVLRLFCEGEKTVQTGGVRIAAQKGRVTVSPVGEEMLEKGFTLLIKKPGIYTIEERTVEVFEGRFPFILRSAKRGEITAEYAGFFEKFEENGRNRGNQWQIIK